MKSCKALILVTLTIISLFVINFQLVCSQEELVITILNNGDISPPTADGLYIQRDGDIYTFLNDLPSSSLLIERSGATIDGAGLALSGEADFGIQVMSVNDVTIRNVIISGVYFYGINIIEASNTKIINNTILGNIRGIFAVNSTQINISENTVINNEVGLFMMSSRDSILRNNDFNNQNNLAIFGTELSHFMYDIDTSNKIGNKKIYYLINEANLVITPDTYPDVGFLALVRCTNIDVRNIDLEKNGQGIILAYTTDSTLSQSTIKNNQNGILLFGSTNNEITGNTIITNYRAIQLSKSSTGNTISSNIIADNREGILLFDSPSNTIISNNVTNNFIGIGFSKSSNNMIRSNFFIDNDEQVFDVSGENPQIAISTNFWSFGYPIGGNYWSDYGGFDLKSGPDQDQEGPDDIGDTPYVINSVNQDEYPIMPFGAPFAISVVSPENKTYTKTSIPLTLIISKTDAEISYSLDGNAKITITESATLSDLSIGSHHVTIYAKDNEGNERSNTVFFTISKEGDSPQNGDITDIPMTLIAAAIGIVAIVAIGLFFFFRMRKKEST